MYESLVRVSPAQSSKLLTYCLFVLPFETCHVYYTLHSLSYTNLILSAGHSKCIPPLEIDIHQLIELMIILFADLCRKHLYKSNT